MLMSKIYKKEFSMVPLQSKYPNQKHIKLWTLEIGHFKFSSRVHNHQTEKWSFPSHAHTHRHTRRDR